MSAVEQTARVLAEAMANNSWAGSRVAAAYDKLVEAVRVADKPAVRPLSAIAWEVCQDWRKVYFGAVPYLAAMASLDKITDAHFHDSASSVVRYFLANAATWRGPVARRVKLELKAMLA